MALKRLSAYNASDSNDLADKIKDQLVAAGWTLHDDLSGANSRYIMKSFGEEKTTKIPCYLDITAGSTANRLEMTFWVFWNSTSHAGVLEIGATTSAYILSDDDAAFYAWIYCSKDFLAVVTKLGSTYTGTVYGRYASVFKPIGFLQSGITSGDGKTIQLAKGQTAGFVIGSNVMLLCLDGTVGRDESVLITAIDHDLHQLTVNSVSYNFTAGSAIGYYPYPWCMRRTAANTVFSLWGGSGTGAYTTGGTEVVLPGAANADPETLSSLYLLSPAYYTGAGAGLSGYLDRWAFHDPFSITSYEDTVCVSIIQDDTIATSGGANTLTDSAQTWDTNEHLGKAIVIIQGTGAGQIRTITGNTSDTVTTDDNWSTNPDDTSHYIICEEAYRHFGFANIAYSSSFIEGGYLAKPICFEITTTTTTTTA